MVVNTINDLVTLLDLADQDVIVLGSIANDSATSTDSGVGPGLVTTRAGDSVKNVQKVIADIENGITSGVATAADREATAADREATAADREATAADLVETNQDTIDTAADRVQTGLDRTAVAADLVQTNDDQIAVAADAAQVATDKADVAANLVLTDADTEATAADLLQTNADVAASSVNASAASTSASATAISVADAEAAAAMVNGVVTPLNSEILWPVSLTPFPTGWYDTTLRLLAGTSARAILSNNVIFSYSANDITPQLVADFKGGVYGKDSVLSTFDNVLNHARNGNATMVDADGLLKWAPHNLLTFSEDLVNYPKRNYNSAFTSNTTTAPDGNLTADTYTDDVGTSTGGFGSSGNYSDYKSVKMTYSVYAKRFDTDLLSLQISYQYNYANIKAEFNLATGVVSNSGVRGADTTIESSILDVGNGWYKCTLTGITNNNNNAIVFTTLRDVWSSYNDINNYTPSGKSAYLWGLHFYRSDLGGMVNNPNADVGFETYVPTTDAVRYLARENHHVYNGSAWVKEGYLHEPEAATNLITYAEDFTDASWTNPSDGLGLTAGEISPTGEADAYRAVPTAISNAHRVSQFCNVTDGLYHTTHVFAKADGYNFLELRIAGGGGSTGGITSSTRAFFNLSTGVVSSTGADAIATIQDFGNGWFRCSVTGLATATGTLNQEIYAIDQDYDNDFQNWTGDGTSGVLFFGAQSEVGSVPTSYIATAGSTVTRAADTLTLPVANIPYPEPVVIGTEEITNAGGPFLNTTDWSPTTSTLSVVGGNLRITGTGTFARAQISIAGLVVGKTYEITIGLASTQGSDSSFWLNQGFGSRTRQSVSGVAQEYKFVATATATTGTLILYTTVNSDGTGEYSDWSTASIKEANPLAVSIGYKALVTGQNSGSVNWTADANNGILMQSGTNDFTFTQEEGGTVDSVTGGSYTSGVNVPVSIAMRNGTSFINGADDGTALTTNTTPTSFPDLSATDLIIAPSGGPQVIQEFIMWGGATGDIGDTGIEETSA